MRDESLEHLLLLDGTQYAIDEKLGLWVKFSVKEIEPNAAKPWGIRYL